MPLDYYQILAIPRTAKAEQIKLSFHNLAKLYHPDISADSDAERKFKEISMAYNTLIDPKKKSKYDLKLKYSSTSKTKSAEQYRDFRKYGTRDKTREHGDSSKAYYSSKNQKSKMEKIFSDKFLFWSLISVGIFAIAVGLVDLIFFERKEDEPIHINGLILGIVFTTLLIIGWKSMRADSE